MRQTLFDTETTGLDPREHRLVSVAAVELIDDQLTGRFCHWHINPERPCDPGAAAIHGLSDEYLATQPKFAEIRDPLMEFLGNSPTIIHNARFDRGMLTQELFRLHSPGTRWDPASVMPPYYCTYDEAVRRRGIGKGRNTLDTLCRVYGAQNLRTASGKHGALIDALTLFHVYRALRFLPRAPMIQSAIDHYVTKGFGVHGGFTELRAGSESVPAQARSNPTAQPADVRAVGGGAGQDVLGAAPVHHAPAPGTDAAV